MSELIACPLLDRDRLPSCQMALPIEQLDHLKRTHLAGTGMTPQSFTSTMSLKVSSLRKSAGILAEEGKGELAPILEHLADQLWIVSNALTVLQIAAAQQRLAEGARAPRRDLP